MSLKTKIKTQLRNIVKEILKEDAPIVVETTTEPIDSDLYQKEGETQAEYNERIPVAVQPVQPGAKYSYLGKEL
jgi:hypothetical protein